MNTLPTLMEGIIINTSLLKYCGLKSKVFIKITGYQKSSHLAESTMMNYRENYKIGNPEMNYVVPRNSETTKLLLQKREISSGRAERGVCLMIAIMFASSLFDEISLSVPRSVISTERRFILSPRSLPGAGKILSNPAPVLAVSSNNRLLTIHGRQSQLEGRVSLWVFTIPLSGVESKRPGRDGGCCLFSQDGVLLTWTPPIVQTPGLLRPHSAGRPVWSKWWLSSSH